MQPELLAHHCTEAGQIGQAIAYWRKAGERAIQRSAKVEALSHVAKGLELLNGLPYTHDRLLQELSLQVALGSVMMAVKGYASSEVESAYARARVLCQQVGDSSQLFPILRGLIAFYVNRAELSTARDLGEELLSLAHRQQNRSQLTEAHYLLAVAYFFLGQLSAVWTHTQQGLALHDPGQNSAQGLRTVEDPTVSCHAFAGLALWLMGYPEQALQRIRHAVTIAREIDSPHNLAFALVFAAWLHQFRRERAEVQELAEAVVVISTEKGFPFWAALGTSLRGWAMAEGGREEDITQLRQGVAAWHATGAKTLTPYYDALLAEAYGKNGQDENCLGILAEALTAVNKTGECFYEAELHRLEGEGRLKQFVLQSQELEAEECFQRAINVARKQNAKSLELRSVMSLARLGRRPSM
jgi:predicted ATPase